MNKLFYILPFLIQITLSTSLLIGQVPEVKRGKAQTRVGGQSSYGGTEIDSNFYFHVMNPQKSKNYIEQYDKDLQLIKSTMFKKPGGYYLDSKIIDKSLFCFYLMKDKEVGRKGVYVQKYDLVTGTLVTATTAIFLNNYHSKPKIDIINDTLFSVYAGYDEGYLMASCLTTQLEKIASQEILLPTEIDKKYNIGVFFSLSGELIAGYSATKKNEEYKGCLITAKGSKINVQEKDFSICTQFGLVPLSLDKSVFLITSSIVDLTKTAISSSGYFANTIDELTIYEFEKLLLKKKKTINLNQEKFDKKLFSKYLVNNSMAPIVELTDNQKTTVLEYKKVFVTA
jgi:hypothetical protein